MNGTTLSTLSRNNFNQLLESQDGIKQMITTEETSPSTHAYQRGNYLIYNNNLYKVTATIDVGNTLNTATNISLITVGEELTATAGSAVGQSVTPPTLTTSSYTYDGTSKSPVFSGFDSDTMTIMNNAATNADQYTAVIALSNPADTWSDTDDSLPKTYSWSISKATPTISVSNNSVTLDLITQYESITISTTSDSSLSIISYTTDIATIENLSGNTYKITGIAKGVATIVVSTTETANYSAISTTIAVTCNLPSYILDENSWATISQVSSLGLGSTYWHVGDYKKVIINGKVGSMTYSNLELYVYIMDFDHNAEIEGYGISFGGFMYKNSSGMVHIAICSSNGLGYSSSTDGTKRFNINHWSNYNYGGWAGCDLRYDILGSTDVAPSNYGSAVNIYRVGYDATSTCATNPVSNTLMAALPTDLRAVMKPITKWSNNKQYDASVSTSSPVNKYTATIDYLPIPSVYEIYGPKYVHANLTHSNQTQYAYFMNYLPICCYKFYTDIQIPTRTYDAYYGRFWSRDCGPYSQYSDNMPYNWYYSGDGGNSTYYPTYSYTGSNVECGLRPIFLI